MTNYQKAQKLKARVRELEETVDALADLYLNDFDAVEWQTFDGKKVKLPDMEDRHLQNAISWCQRRLAHAMMISLWMGSVKVMAHNLVRLLNEAERRGLKV